VTPAAPPQPSVFAATLSRLAALGLPHTIHEHSPTRTMAEAERDLDFEPGRIVKTIAFRTRAGAIVLAALCGTQRVDYARLAALVGVRRSDLSSLSPAEVLEYLGVEPGCVSPVDTGAAGLIVVDEAVLELRATIYCGTGRADRTLEVTPEALVQLAGGRTGIFARQQPAEAEPPA